LNLSIIIISFNTKDLLRVCIKSVYETTANLIYEIIIVDNGSTDGSIDMLAIEFPEIHVINNKINQGFARANNQAIKVARGKLILLLNSDTIVKKGAIESLAEFMKEHRSIAAVGPKILNVNGTLQSMEMSLPSIGDTLISLLGLPHFVPMKFKRRLFPRLFRNENEISSVGWINGCCIMLNKDIIEKVGLLDETFFFYYEEIEWCYRAKKAGYSIFYKPDVEIIHYGGASNIDKPTQRMLNGRLIFYKKCLGRTKGITFIFLKILSNISTLTIAYATKSNSDKKNILKHKIRQDAEFMYKLMLD